MKSYIPENSNVYQTINKISKEAKIVAFSGLPGVGKSLYINQFYQSTRSNNRSIDVIQWDVARKTFETPEISAIYPIEHDTVHNGVKLAVGQWLMNYISDWIADHSEDDRILLIEAPLVGHRFVEIAKKTDDNNTESFLASNRFQVLVPIPSKKVRAVIEDSRKAQVAEDAKDWKGAKPSVMLMLWKMICGIANEMGRSISMDGQPAYDPEIYQYVFAKVLSRRQMVPMIIDEIFDVAVDDEDALHSLPSITPSYDEALRYTHQIQIQYPDQQDLDAIVDTWYLNEKIN